MNGEVRAPGPGGPGARVTPMQRSVANGLLPGVLQDQAPVAARRERCRCLGTCTPERLLAHPRFFTPTGSSWLNLVERWFAGLTTKQIRRGVHKSVQSLEKDIRAWNENPRPFVWMKTAEEILDTLASYWRRVTDSGH